MDKIFVCVLTSILKEIKENYDIDSMEDELNAIEGYLCNVAAVQYEMDSIKKVIGEGDSILQEYSELEDNSQTVIDIFDKHLEDAKSQDTRDVKYVFFLS